MSERYLSAKVYRDEYCPEVSVDRATAGIEIVRTIAPWIKIEKESRSVRVADSEREFIVGDKVAWPKLEADLNVVLTNRHFGQ
jgi:hypothetical protein